MWTICNNARPESGVASHGINTNIALQRVHLNVNLLVNFVDAGGIVGPALIRPLLLVLLAFHWQTTAFVAHLMRPIDALDTPRYRVVPVPCVVWAGLEHIVRRKMICNWNNRVFYNCEPVLCHGWNMIEWHDCGVCSILVFLRNNTN